MLAPDRIGYGATPGEARGAGENAELVAGVHPGPGGGPGHRWWPTAGRAGWRCAGRSRHPDTVKSLVLVGAACTPDSLNAVDQWLNAPVLGPRPDRGRAGGVG